MFMFILEHSLSCCNTLTILIILFIVGAPERRHSLGSFLRREIHLNLENLLSATIFYFSMEFLYLGFETNVPLQQWVP